MESGGANSGGSEATASENSESPGQLQRVFYCHECQRRSFPNAEHIQVDFDSFCLIPEFYFYVLNFRILPVCTVILGLLKM